MTIDLGSGFTLTEKPLKAVWKETDPPMTLSDLRSAFNKLVAYLTPDRSESTAVHLARFIFFEALIEGGAEATAMRFRESPYEHYPNLGQ